jgi:Holliday junction resolvasome RuvABC endonuclease subunit
MAKLTIQQIESELTEKGYIPIELKNYQNTKSPIIIKCENGHLLTTNLFSFRKSTFRCPKCDGGEIKLKGYPPIKNGYRILALDNATEQMGLSIYDDGKLVYYDLLTFKGHFDDRITKISKIVNEIMIKNWEPDYITFEDIQYQNNYQTYKKLAMLLGCLIVAAKSNNIGYEIVPPAQWRSYFQIVGKRDEIKRKAVKLVNEMFNINVIDDIAEAILIGKYISDKQYLNNIEAAF